jgi:hypothetical protein
MMFCDWNNKDMHTHQAGIANRPWLEHNDLFVVPVDLHHKNALVGQRGTTPSTLRHALPLCFGFPLHTLTALLCMPFKAFNSDLKPVGSCRLLFPVGRLVSTGAFVRPLCSSTSPHLQTHQQTPVSDVKTAADKMSAKAGRKPP